MARKGRHSDRISAMLAGAAALALAAIAPGGADAAAVKKLTVHVEGVRNNGPIPPECAFCVPSEQGHTKRGANTNPAIKWSKGPAGSQSYAIIVVDTDVPTVFDDAGITEKGKPPGPTANGVRGINDYSQGGAGNYGGYGGPCPPWNDEILHHYHFIVYALDVASLGVTGNFSGADAQAAIAKHALAKGEIVGTCTQNPALMNKSKTAKNAS